MRRCNLLLAEPSFAPLKETHAISVPQMTGMKVAIVDNVCNTGYVLMRYLNDAGYDTDLLFTEPQTGHNTPADDTYDRQYFGKIHDIAATQKGVLRHPASRYRAVFAPYDFVIGSSMAPLMFGRMCRMLDVFMPHGPDIFTTAFPERASNPFSKDALYAAVVARWQRRGIARYTQRVLFELTNEQNEGFLARFKTPAFERHCLTPPLLYTPQYRTAEHSRYAESSPHAARLRALKAAGYTVTIHHCQQQWKNLWHDLFHKGNDLLLHGVKAFTESHPQYPLKIALFERGPDVAASKALVQELGLRAVVEWFPSMPRKDIMALLTHADLGFGEIKHSWYTYNVMAEMLASGVPLVHHRRDDYYRTVHPDLYPMRHAATAEDVAAVLSDYAADPAPFRALGQAGRQWWEGGLVEGVLQKIIGWIEEKRSAAR